jgi:hypothetical protein
MATASHAMHSACHAGMHSASHHPATVHSSHGACHAATVPATHPTAVSAATATAVGQRRRCQRKCCCEGTRSEATKQFVLHLDPPWLIPAVPGE